MREGFDGARHSESCYYTHSRIRREETWDDPVAMDATYLRRHESAARSCSGRVGLAALVCGFVQCRLGLKDQ